MTDDDQTAATRTDGLDEAGTGVDAAMEAELEGADRMTDAVEDAVDEALTGAAVAAATEVAVEAGAADPEPLDDITDHPADEALAALADAEDIEPGDVIVEEELLEEFEEAPAAPVESPYDRPGKWYVLHTQSGYENKVRQNIEARRNSMNMESKIHEVVIPMEDVVEFKQGKKVVVQKKMFPGYLLVRCSLDDDSWYVIRNTPGVTGFVGAGNKPQPLPRKDVENFLQVKLETEEAPKRTRPRLEYEINETVRVKEGPFADFSGEIVEINEDQLKLKVLVDIFERQVPVELGFDQVKKID
jgi:transcriptional antiterminator NusG